MGDNMSFGFSTAVRPEGVEADDPSYHSRSSVDPSNRGMEPAEPSGRSGRRYWDVARNMVKISAALNNFTTLRDVVGADTYIAQPDLKTVKELGQGAFARVTLARMQVPETGGEREVAVKTLKPELLEDPAEVKLFLEEVKLLRKLRHRSIVEFIGCGSNDQKATAEPGRLASFYYVSEVLPGGNLLELVRKQMMQPFKKLYTEADALRWCIDVCGALQYLHSRRPMIIHRDLKLDNIMLTDIKPSLASAKLADFGLARLVALGSDQKRLKTELEALMATPQDKWGPRLQQSSSRLSDRVLDRIISQTERHATAGSARGGSRTASRKVSGALPDDLVLPEDKEVSPTNVASLAGESAFTSRSTSFVAASYREMTGKTGSYSYMAPEVLLSRPYDDKADIFSLGMVMYCLFARTIPAAQIMMEGGDEEDLIVYAYKVANGYRPPIPKHVPQPVADIIEFCLKGIPGLRPTAMPLLRMMQEVRDTGILGISEGDCHAHQGCKCVVS